ncbi:MAG: DUF4105 domain-containing protein [Myxococcales bacterium]|nr:DUF4105 domain-containing protein [Myxococcales bacterium]
MKRLAAAALALWLLWSAAAVWLGGVGPEGPWPWRAVGLGVGVAIVGWGARVHRLWATGVGVGVAVLLWYATLRPSADRTWSEDQSRLPRVSIVGDTLTVRDLRAFRYRATDDWDARWVDRSWDLTALQGVDFAVERFSHNEAVAHTFLSFRFADAQPLVVSVEIRKEVGERFGPVRGLFRQFELMYVLADERDAVELRAVHRGNAVYLHPMRATPHQSRAFLESLMAGARAIEEHPRFYNTVAASCTTVLAQHLQEVFDLPLDHRIYLPGYSDALAFELELIETDVDFEATRQRHRITERAQAAQGRPDFSDAIRTVAR